MLAQIFLYMNGLNGNQVTDSMKSMLGRTADSSTTVSKEDVWSRTGKICNKTFTGRISVPCICYQIFSFLVVSMISSYETGLSYSCYTRIAVQVSTNYTPKKH